MDRNATILQATADEAEALYRAALRSGAPTDSLVVVHVLDFKRTPAVELVLELVGAKEVGGVAYTISVEPRSVVRRDLAEHCPGAAAALACGPRSDKPMTVAAMSSRRVTIVDRPLRAQPRAPLTARADDPRGRGPSRPTRPDDSGSIDDRPDRG